MALLKGIHVVLITKTVIGKDGFNRDITEDVRETVENVLVAPVSQTDVAVINELAMNGKKAVYQLAIPKGDTHNWEDAEIEFFGERWRSVGMTTQGLEHLIPLAKTDICSATLFNCLMFPGHLYCAINCCDAGESFTGGILYFCAKSTANFVKRRFISATLSLSAGNTIGTVLSL